MKRISCLLLALVILLSCAVSCDRNGKGNNVAETTAQRTDSSFPPDTTTSPLPQTNEDTSEYIALETTAPETTAPETTAPETTAPETTAPETTAPETTAPATIAPTETTAAPVEPDDPKSEYLTFKNSNGNAVMVIWPSSEKKFNVLASYDGKSSENLEGLANQVYSYLRKSTAPFVIMSDGTHGGVSHKDEWCEILIGSTTREATQKVKAELAFDEYAIKVVGNDVVVTGLGYATTREAVRVFKLFLDKYKDTSQELVYRIPSDFSYVGRVTKYGSWKLDIPEYTGGVLDSVTSADNNGYVAVYRETSQSDYYAYTASLSAAGYTKYFENNMAGNLYSIYKNESEIINAYFLPYSNMAYIVVEDAAKVTLPSLENEYMPTGVTSSLTQMKLNNVTDSNGECYVFRLSDGRFIIVDGGGNDKKNGKTDSDNLMQLLYDLSLGKKPVIAAWFITHLHGDHYNVMVDFANRYNSKVKVENFIFNFPPDEMSEASTGSAYNKVIKAMNNFSGAKLITAHTGQKYNFANAEIEMLYAPEMLCPNYITFFNDSSLVFFVTIEGTKTLITGDASPNTSAMMCEMYKKYLQCDILQIAHHGSFGCSVEYYEYTNPRKLALMPVGETQKKRLTSQEENVFISKLVRIVPHYSGTQTFYLPYN